MRKRIFLSVLGLSLLTLASASDVTPALNAQRVQLKKLDSQLQKILDKTENLTHFKMVDIRLLNN